jgi:hypothetical protein
MLYPYNPLFGRCLLTTFEAALQSAYLCLKVPATFGAITVSGDQKEARDIEQGVTPGHMNVHFLRQDTSMWWPLPKQKNPSTTQMYNRHEGESTKAVEPR